MSQWIMLNEYFTNTMVTALDKHEINATAIAAIVTAVHRPKSTKSCVEANTRSTQT